MRFPTVILSTLLIFCTLFSLAGEIPEDDGCGRAWWGYGSEIQENAHLRLVIDSMIHKAKAAGGLDHLDKFDQKLYHFLSQVKCWNEDALKNQYRAFSRTVASTRYDPLMSSEISNLCRAIQDDDWQFNCDSDVHRYLNYQRGGRSW